MFNRSRPRGYRLTSRRRRCRGMKLPVDTPDGGLERTFDDASPRPQRFARMTRGFEHRSCGAQVHAGWPPCWTSGRQGFSWREGGFESLLDCTATWPTTSSRRRPGRKGEPQGSGETTHCTHEQSTRPQTQARPPGRRWVKRRVALPQHTGRSRSVGSSMALRYHPKIFTTPIAQYKSPEIATEPREIHRPSRTST